MTSSPTEMILQLFDDSGLNDLLPEGQVFLPEADRALRRLSEAADKVDLEQEPVQLLADPAWMEMQKRAREALESVKAALGVR